jgi:uncharacterized protein (TIGR02594 family)
MITTPFEMAQTFMGTKEVEGIVDNPLILAMLRTDDTWPKNDEVPWCSAFMNFVCKCCRVVRSKSLAAKSWLNFGLSINLNEAQIGFDVIILHRGTNPANGHVGFYAGMDGANKVRVLGGNQSNSVSIDSFPVSRIAGVRRLT